MKTLIENAIIINERKRIHGSLLIEDDRISEIIPEKTKITTSCDHIIDAKGCYLLPGVIDEHVHFREPGLTHKGTIFSESRAAAAGGVTSFFDMPNTIPQTTTIETLEEKKRIARHKSLINYSFFFGATNDNIDMLHQLDKSTICGVKLFMGASTGNMLVDNQEQLLHIFQESPLPIMTHCEDMNILSRNTQQAILLYGNDLPIKIHSLIRSKEACYRSTALSIQLAKETHKQLHVAHISSKQELELFKPNDTLITAETCLSYLYFTEKDYDTLGARIKCNPAIKGEEDKVALREALNNGKISTLGTDHAPHLLSEKHGGALQAVSGIPSIQFSLIAMLELCQKNILTLERLVELTSHNPAKIFKIKDRGFLRPGYKADFVLVRPERSPHAVSTKDIISPCKWSPFEGHTFNWSVEQTYCNGTKVYDRALGIIEAAVCDEILFDR